MNASNAPAGEVKLHFLDYWRVIRVRYGIILLAFFLVVLTTGVYTWFLPREYKSSVFIQVQSRLNETPIFSPDDPTGARVVDPIFAQTQFEIIQRADILIPVIQELNLTERWGNPGQPISEEVALLMLRSKLAVSTVRNTDMLSISYFSTDPKEAAEIANKITDSYLERRAQRFRRTVSGGLDQLDNEVAKQEEEVKRRYNLMLKAKEDAGITDLGGETDEPVLAVDREFINKLDEVNATRLAVTADESLLKQIDTLTPEELMRALPTLRIDDPIVSKNLPLYQDAVSLEARLLESGLGPNHPQVQEIRAQAAVILRQLNEQISSIERSVRSRLDVSKLQLAKLEDQLAQAEQRQRDAKQQSAVYARAKADYNEARRILESAKVRLQTREMDSSMPLTPGIIWERATESSFPARPNVWLNMALGILVGLIVGIGLAFFIEYLDTSIKTLEDVEHLLNLPVLAVIPRNVGLLHTMTGESPDAEAYRIMRTNIEFNRKSVDANALTFVSGGSGEGKSTTLANLAFTCAQGGYSVLIVDADLRRPVQHRLFGMSNQVGLTNFLTTNVGLEEVVFQTAIDNLFLMPSGVLPSDAVGILNSQRMSDMVADVKTRFDLVFFDSPPVLGVSDASVLASEVDLTIMVVQHRRFPRSMLVRVKSAVQNVGGSILGVVLNNVDIKHDPNYGYYTNYYSYYATTSQATSRKQMAAAMAVPAGTQAAQNRRSSSDEEY